MKIIKKITTVFTLLVATSCAPAYADNVRTDFCLAQKGLAEVIMKARQLDTPRSVLEDHIERKASERAKSSAMILMNIAYKYQVLEQKPSKELIKNLFGMEVFSQCYSGETSGVMDSFPLVGQTKEDSEKEEWLKL